MEEPESWVLKICWLGLCPCMVAYYNFAAAGLCIPCAGVQGTLQNEFMHEFQIF